MFYPDSLTERHSESFEERETRSFLRSNRWFWTKSDYSWTDTPDGCTGYTSTRSYGPKGLFREETPLSRPRPEKKHPSEI